MPLDPETANWINSEAAKLDKSGDAMGSPRETEMLETWKRVRPEMYRNLGPLASKMAYVLVAKCYRSMQQYIQSGMPPADAVLEATREWCLLEPEDETQPHPLLAPTSISTIPTG